MKKAYLGIDIGSISTKGVIINEENEILAQCYLWTEGNPMNASKNVLHELKSQFDDCGFRDNGERQKTGGEHDRCTGCEK